MFEVTVKTLDGQNRSFDDISETLTVRQFKEKIAESIAISADTQRLIFQGRVLQDEKLLKDYDVNGKVIHVVVRPPPSSGRPGSDRQPPSTTSGANGSDVNSIVVGSFTLPSEILDANTVQNIAQEAIRNLGDLGRNARVSTRTNSDGSAVDVHIHLGPVNTGQTTSEAQMRLNTATQMLSLAQEALNQLENPQSTNNGDAAAPQAGAAETERTAGGSPTVATETVANRVSSTSDLPDTQSPMETSDTEEASSTVEGQSSDNVGSTQSTAENSASANQTTGTSASSQSSTGTTGNGSQPPRGLVRPNITALGEVLVEIAEVNRRLQPHIERFTRIVQDDAQMDQTEQRENQRVCNMVSEAMHAVSHSYHAVSDLMVDLSQQRPRQLYVTLAIAHPHTHVIQQSVPVQMQIPINPLSHLRRPTAQNATPRNANTATTQGTSRSSTTSTASTGTSTGPLPTTTETGTQPTASTGTSTVDAGIQFQPHVEIVDIEDDELMQADVERIAQQMTAGLQNVLGQQGGLQQGDGSPDNPYVFVQMGPETVTVSQISTQVVTSSDTRSTTTPTTSVTTSNPSTANTSSGTQSRPTTTPSGPQADTTPQPGPQNLPPNHPLGGFISQIIQQAGAGSPQRFQINIGHQGPVPVLGMHRGGAAGIPIRLVGQHPGGLRPGAPGSQTGTAGAGVAPSSGTQTSATPTSTFGTQTPVSSASNTSSTQTPAGSGARTAPSNTSGTQTGPRAATFIVPGLQGVPGNANPVDPYVPCSSRHFLTRHARNVIHQTSPQNSDNALADMVTNLMSGLLGVTPPTTSTTQPSSTAASSTTSTSTFTAQAGGIGSQPRPTVHTATMRGSIPNARLHFSTPPNLANMFPGRMPFIPGMRFRIGNPQTGPGSQPRPAASQPASQPATSAAGQRPAGTTTTSSASTGSTGAPGAEPAFLQTLRTMLQTTGGQPMPNTDRNQNVESVPTESGQSQMPISDEAFTQLVGNITGYMTQAAMGQAPRQTIGDFLGNLGENYNIPQGEGFINDVFSCVVSQLAITDLLQVFAGHAAPLNRTQASLRQFLSERVLDGAPPFPENIREAVDRLVERMQPEITDTVTAATPVAHVDFEATLTQFLTQQFFNIITLIMNSRDNDELFGRDLYACVRRFLGELFVVCSRCLGGMTAVQNLVSQRLRSLSQGVNPAIQDWMGAMTIRQMATFLPSITVNEGEVSFYIVYRDAANSDRGVRQSAGRPQASTSASSSTTTTASKSQSTMSSRSESQGSSAAKGSQDREAGKSPTQPMELSSPSSSPGAAEVMVEKQKSPTTVKGAASSEVELPKRGRVVSPSPREPSPAGAEAEDREWQAVVPQDWVPVIERDIQTQRSQPPQRPHSDVYLQGMPPKRRKLMTQDRPSDLSNTQETLSASLRRAVAAAAVEPISSLENLSSEAASDTELQAAFDGHMTNAVSQRLEADSDYKSERFPHTEDYYHKNSYRKK